MSIRITCISKDGGNHENPYEAISSLGWVNEQTGEAGSSTRLQMYTWVRNGGEAYVVSGSDRARLITATSSHGNPYVKTVADETKRDNLLSLREC